MSYAESKVYFDGSHYIAIPHTTRPVKKRPKMPEETITVEDRETKSEEEFEPVISPKIEEEFETEEGKELMRKWGVGPQYEGIGHCILGYPESIPETKPRKNGYIIKIK